MNRGESDDWLRRESPAYRPDDDWTELEPQSMQVVLSVRLDSRSARRIGQVARELGTSSSGLLRDWTLQRLEQLNSGDAHLEAAGVREGRGAYRAGDLDYEELRDRFRPEPIDTLLVGESRPAGGTFFYLANSNLFYATHDAFQRAQGPMPPGEAFLSYLRDNGVWLYDLVAQPVDHLPGRPRRSAVQARIGQLVALLRHSQPSSVVVIKKSLAPTVRQALEEADLSLERLVVLPFPLYQWRADYVRGLAAVVASEARGR